MIRGLLWLALLGFGIYICYHYAAPQLRAWRFHDAMKQGARLTGTQPASELRASLLETARKLDVPLTANRLTVRRDAGGRIQVGASWREVVRIRAWKLGEWVDTLHYEYEVESTGRGPSR